MTFIFWFVGNSLIHASVIEDDWNNGAGRAWKCHLGAMNENPQRNSGLESGLVLKQNTTSNT